MAEQLDLTTPVVDTKTTSNYRVTYLMMNEEMLFADPSVPFPPVPPTPPIPPVPPIPGVVSITVKDNLGMVISHTFFGVLAQDMIKFVNTGDFTTRSLHKRILEKLSAMGLLVGTVSGTPEVPSAPTGLE